MKYDYFVAGRWTNHANIKRVVEAIRQAGKTTYCFIDNEYDGDGVVQTKNPSKDDLAKNNVAEILDWQTNPTFKKMFQKDIDGLRNSKELVFVFPAGLSTHMELGAAYGMGKKSYGIGAPEKIETLYLMFDQIFPTVDDFVRQIS